MQTALRRRFADHPLVGEVRGVGLIGGDRTGGRQGDAQQLRPEAKRSARAWRSLARQHGVIGRSLANDTLAFSPPLIITEAEIDEMLGGMGRALDDLTVQLRREKIAAVA